MERTGPEDVDLDMAIEGPLDEPHLTDELVEDDEEEGDHEGMGHQDRAQAGSSPDEQQREPDEQRREVHDRRDHIP